MQPHEDQPTGVTFSRASELYHRKFFETLKVAFPEQLIESRLSAYADQSPIPLVGSADRVILFAFYEGDNWETTYAQVGMLADAFTGSDDIAGANTNSLGVFFLDLEGRHDRREEKTVSDSTQRAIVKSQGVPPRALARSLRANGVEFVITVNVHSHLIDKIFKNVGLEHIPLATEPVLIDELTKRGYFTDQTLSELVIGTTDIGGLKEAVTAKRYIDARFGIFTPISIIKKQRIPLGDGKSKTEQEFAFGNVQDKRVLVIDDRSDSAKSIKGAVDIYGKQGAHEVVVYITHPVFADANYYQTIQELLRNPKVKFVFVSNSLPMGEDRVSRKGGIDIPYVWVNGINGKKRQKKQLEILDIHPFVIKATKTILDRPTLEEAVKIFTQQKILLDMRSPYQTFEELTQAPLPRSQVIAIYDHGQFMPLPHSSISSSST